MLSSDRIFFDELDEGIKPVSFSDFQAYITYSISLVKTYQWHKTLTKATEQLQYIIIKK